MDDIIRKPKNTPAEKPEKAKINELKQEPTKEPAKFEEKPAAGLKTEIAAIKWEAPEYEYVPKSNNWFWSVAIVAISVILASALLGNFLFAILGAVAALAVIVYGARRPRKVIFSFTARGIKIDKHLFPYENLESFWLHYDPPLKKFLTVEPKKLFMPTITVPLADTDPNAIRDYLLKFLKEERHEESLITTITRLLGF